MKQEKKINWRGAKFNAKIEVMFVKALLKTTIKLYDIVYNMIKQKFHLEIFKNGYFEWNHIETQLFIVCVSFDSLSEV